MNRNHFVAAALIALMGAGCAASQPPVVPPAGQTGGNTPPPVVMPQKDDLIQVTNLQAGAVVKSPLHLEGKARGNWYFEASFPVKLIDGNGKVLVQKPAQAKGEWMTTEYVPFALDLAFVTPTTATGTLILEKDNPSGLPEHDNSLQIPVKF